MAKLTYILLLIVAAIFYPLYENVLSLMILVTLLVLPVLLFADLIAKRQKIGFSAGESIVTGKGTHDAVFTVSCGGISPVTMCRAYFDISSLPSGSSEKITEEISIPARDSAPVTVPVESLHYGETTVTLRYVKVTDLLGLFTLKKAAGISMTVTAIPAIDEKYLDEANDISAAVSAEDDDGDIPTTSPGSVIDFRDYRPGDRLSLVHHKLSARFDKDIVKIMGSSAEQGVCLAADIEGANENRRDEILEQMLCISYFLMDMGTSVMVSLPEGTVPVKDTDAYKSIACAAVRESILPTEADTRLPVIVFGGDDI